MESKTNVKMLWTGGWDSTFRLCSLLDFYDCLIQPYYLIDPERKSYTTEINTIYSLKNELDQYFDVSRILPIKFYCKHDIRPNKAITRRYQKIRGPINLGEQYEWLARLLQQENISDIELSIEKGRIYNYIGDYLQEHSGPFGTYHSLKRKYYDTEFSIFKNMRFPIITITREEMVRMAKEEKFYEILNSTWFCHRPLKLPFTDPIPCGACNPCVSAIKDGFAYRVPFLTRYTGRYIKKMYHSSFFQFVANFFS